MSSAGAFGAGGGGVASGASPGPRWRPMGAGSRRLFTVTNDDVILGSIVPGNTRDFTLMLKSLAARPFHSIGIMGGIASGHSIAADRFGAGKARVYSLRSAAYHIKDDVLGWVSESMVVFTLLRIELIATRSKLFNRTP